MSSAGAYSNIESLSDATPDPSFSSLAAAIDAMAASSCLVCDNDNDECAEAEETARARPDDERIDDGKGGDATVVTAEPGPGADASRSLTPNPAASYATLLDLPATAAAGWKSCKEALIRAPIFGEISVFRCTIAAATLLLLDSAVCA